MLKLSAEHRTGTTTVLLGLLLSLGYLLLALILLRSAPAGRFLEVIELHVAESGVTLGHAELGHRPGSRSAEKSHLVVERDTNRAVVGNRSARKRVDTNRGFIKRWRLQDGDHFWVHDHEFVVALDQKSLRIVAASDGTVILWDGVGLGFESGDVAKDCPGQFRKWKHLLVTYAWELSWGRLFRGERFLFSIGGAANCHDRWYRPGLDHLALRVTWRDGDYWLAPGWAESTTRFARAEGTIDRFHDLRLPLGGGGVTSIVVGRTHYRIALDGGGTTVPGVRLTPVQNRDFWGDEEPRPIGALPEGSRITWTQSGWIGAGQSPLEWLSLNRWTLSSLAVVLLVASCLVYGWSRIRAGRMAMIALHHFSWMPSAFLLGMMVTWWYGEGSPDLVILLLLAWISWTWTTLLLLRTGWLAGRAGRLWVWATALAGAGGVVLLQIAAGAGNDYWLDPVRKHVMVLGLFSALLGMTTHFRGHAVELTLLLVTPAGQSRIWRWLRGGLLACFVGLLLLQAILGREQGLGPFQPAELAKLVVMIGGAWVGTFVADVIVHRRWLGQRFGKQLWISGKAFGFCVICVLAIAVSVRDFSPVVILLVALWAWLWKLATEDSVRLWRLTPFQWLVAAAVAFVLGLLAWVHHAPGSLPDWVPSRERFLVWADLGGNQHDGFQLLRGLQLAGEGGWLGSGFGNNADVLSLPMVHNDFVLSFVVNRFGILSAILLLVAQIGYLAVLFAVARDCLSSARGHLSLFGWPADTSRYALRVMALALFGLAWVQAAHWVIAWGNGLGLLPVMGQPMTWVSAANSHLVFFAMPLLVLALVANRAVHEEMGARVMVS